MSAVVQLWVWFCAYLNLAGWILSVCHQLDSLGYCIALVVFILTTHALRHHFTVQDNFSDWLRKSRRRFRKILSALFLVVASLVFLGGVLYAPTNYDALTYRLPRVLNWLAAGHWFWVPTINDRMNYSAPATEWLIAPQLAIFHSDRTLFLMNAVSFLLMPGLLFSIFRQTGVARKVAWTWMWILPLACGYATQAGSFGNDLTGAVFGLASVHFGLRARRTGKLQDVCLALLAAALLTGVKVSNLPLVLPCLVAVWPALTLFKRNLLAGLALLGITFLVSAGPIMALNEFYTGSWTGDPHNLSQLQAKNPVAAAFGNSLLLLQQSFLPPVLPSAHEWYQRFNEILPAAWHAWLRQDFPRYYLGGFNELPSEENAGLGCGICITTVILMAAAFLPLTRKKIWSWDASLAIGLAAWIAFFAFMLKMGSEATARLLLPYYPLMFLMILRSPVQNFWLHFRVWKIWLMLVALSVLPAIVFSPSRPLWPALTVSQALLKKYPDNHLAQRIAAVYSGYAARNDPLKPLRAPLPGKIQKVGFIAGSNDTEYSLWRPFGTRTVVCLRQHRARTGLLLPDDIEWIVIRKPVWSEASEIPFDVWCEQHHAQNVVTASIVTIVGRGPEEWCLVHLDRAPVPAGRQ